MNNEAYSNLWGEPTEYRGVKFYPLYVDNYNTYSLMLQLLGFSKNSINDINIIHMSYLKFILFEVKYDNIDSLELLLQLLERVTKKQLTRECILFKPKNKVIQSIDDIDNIAIKFDNVMFNQTDFDKIREIILEQNGVSLDYINQYDPTLEDKLVYTQKGIAPIDFDEEILSFSAYMKMPLNEIRKYTFYQFKKTLSRINLLVDYQMFKPLEVSGQISFKDGSHINNWLNHEKPKGRYDSILVSKDKFIKDNDFFKASEQIDNAQIIK